MDRALSEVRLQAFAKINLGLEVLRLREDGYHELRTVFQSVDIHDDVVLRRRRRPGVTLECDHPAVPAGEDNIAVRAAVALARRAGRSDGVEIRLVKRIPVAGGLGGGSSDAATVLVGLDRLWSLRLGTLGLLPLARRLGADVPYFLHGGTALGVGRGDEVYPLHDQLRAHVVLVDPERPLSTAAVFRRLDRSLTPRENGSTLYRFVSRDLGGSAAFQALTNDLERAALEEAPDLAGRLGRVRKVLLREGAVHAALSGSGSSFFGLFRTVADARRAERTLSDEGFQVLRGRTLTLERYRAARSRTLAPGSGRTR